MVEPHNFSHDEPVSRVSAFYGIVITMYYREHEPPHFQAVTRRRGSGNVVWSNGADMDPNVRHGDFETVDSDYPAGLAREALSFSRGPATVVWFGL